MGNDVKKRKLKKLLKQALGQPAQPSSESPRLADWLGTYWKLIESRGYSEQTLKNLRTLQHHTLRLWGSVRMADLRPHQVTTALTTEFSGKQSTAASLLSYLRKCYTEAAHNGVVDNNPALVVKLARVRLLRSRLSLEVFKRLLTASESHPQKWVRSMLLLALLSGQRRSDLAKMRYSDVVDNMLRVEQQKKAGKPRGARVALPLSLKLDWLDLSLGEVIEGCRAHATGSEFLLCRKGGQPLEVSSLSARFHELMVQVLGATAYPERTWPSLHEIRSLSAREYRRQGLADVQGLLGHKHAEMTAVYEDARDLADDTTWKSVSLQGMIPNSTALPEPA